MSPVAWLLWVLVLGVAVALLAAAGENSRRRAHVAPASQTRLDGVLMALVVWGMIAATILLLHQEHVREARSPSVSVKRVAPYPEAGP